MSNPALQQERLAQSMDADKIVPDSSTVEDTVSENDYNTPSERQTASILKGKKK